MRRVSTLKSAAARAPQQTAWSEKVFAAEEVRRALPYVSRVLADAVEAYGTVQGVRRQLAKCPGGLGHARLSQERDAAVAKLNRTIDECHALGISYIDIPRGRVAFRVEIGGRAASVLWRLGDPLRVAALEGGE